VGLGVGGEGVRSELVDWVWVVSCGCSGTRGVSFMSVNGFVLTVINIRDGFRSTRIERMAF
jgi:hypothetical protein